ncbi:MAG: tetratricopeptide repeat protein [Anaerolineae bacterium]|nr:tetratricopeptide repeat protein [Anaerolineae bacterium]
MDSPPEQSLLSPLTRREQDILRLLANGLSDGEIAQALVLTVGTVKWYNRQIYSKLGVSSRTLAIVRAQQWGLLDDKPQHHQNADGSAPLRHNLPAQVTTFIGRSHERAEVKHLLETCRLLTLTGPPGTGKTRLAIQVASERLAAYSDGVFLISLASIRDPALVAHSIAQALDVKEAGRAFLVAALKQHLRDRKLLLVLDNFEHLLTAAPLLSELLGAAPHLTALVTSREALHLYGEHEFAVPPLQVPNLNETLSIAALQRYEAAQLFVQRAQAVAPTFTLNDENAAAIAAICVHLDGLPLAIELAAARTKLYAPAILLVRLSSRLAVLMDGPRDLPARQKTLRDTLAWSYDLLNPEEQRLFARLGVFAGGCTLNSAQAVCRNKLNLNIAMGLESLLNKSLLHQQSGLDGEPRFVLLETMREYALEKLGEIGETAAIQRLHAEHFLAIAEQAAPALYGSQQMQWLLCIEAEHDNLRTALRWSLSAVSTAQITFRFISSLSRFWELRGHISEGRSWLSEMRLLEAAGELSKARADALRGTGDLAYLQSDYAATQTLYDEALMIYQSLDDQRGIAHTLLGLGEVATEVGDYETAPRLFEQAYAIMRQLGDISGSSRALIQLGWGALRAGHYDQAQVWLEEGLALCRQVDDKASAALVYSGLGEVALRQNRLDQATHLLEESLALRRALGEKWGTAVSLGSLGWIALQRADFALAITLLVQSVMIRKELGDKGGLAWCLEKLGELAHLRQDMTRAARLYGAAASLRASADSVIDPVDRAHYESVIRRIRDALGHALFAAAWAEGENMPLAQVIDVLCLVWADI